MSFGSMPQLPQGASPTETLPLPKCKIYIEPAERSPFDIYWERCPKDDGLFNAFIDSDVSEWDRERPWDAIWAALRTKVGLIVLQQARRAGLDLW